jgi:hypothetical protein
MFSTSSTVSYTVRGQAQESVFTDHFKVYAPSHAEAHAQINQLMNDHKHLFNWHVKYHLTEAEFYGIPDGIPVNYPTFKRNVNVM